MAGWAFLWGTVSDLIFPIIRRTYRFNNILISNYPFVMKHFTLIVFICGILLHCSPQNQSSIVNPSGESVYERFLPPNGYTRFTVEENSFAQYLRNLDLKPFENRVRYYDNSIKNKPDVYISVIDMDIGNRDLQQCADAVMRLRGEYLYQQKKYDQIHFNHLSDGKPRYFTDYAGGDYSYNRFRKFMDQIFAYANTSSLHDEMISVPIVDMQPGDVFIRKGSPYGHAVIVVDMAESESGGKMYLLAQSYMPAQEIQVLVNRNDRSISPWYELKDAKIFTPEWTFEASDLKRFVE